MSGIVDELNAEISFLPVNHQWFTGRQGDQVIRNVHLSGLSFSGCRDCMKCPYSFSYKVSYFAAWTTGKILIIPRLSAQQLYYADAGNWNLAFHDSGSSLMNSTSSRFICSSVALKHLRTAFRSASTMIIMAVSIMALMTSLWTWWNRSSRVRWSSLWNLTSSRIIYRIATITICDVIAS